MSSAADLCEMCPKAATSTCSKCDNSRYCSKACQKRGNKLHKVLCPSFKTFNDTTRPSPLHRRAIYFPVNETHPRFIWFPFERKHGQYDSPVCGDLLGPRTMMQFVTIRANLTLDRRLEDTITIMVREAGLIDDSARNGSVAAVLTPLLRVQHQWMGPMVVYGEVGTAMYPNESKDIDMTDFRHLVDKLNAPTSSGGGNVSNLPSFTQPSQSSTENSTPTTSTMAMSLENLLAHGRAKAHAEQAQKAAKRFPTPKVTGVRISCGLEVARGRAKYESVEVFANDNIFNRYPTSHISERIGVLLIVYQAPDSDHESDFYDDRYECSNPEASALHIDCNPDGFFGQQSLAWNGQLGRPNWIDDVGSAIVVRKDKQPLQPEHVEALCSWCRHKLLPMFHRAQEWHDGPDVLSKKYVLDQVSSARFADYYDAWLEGRGLTGRGPANLCYATGDYNTSNVAPTEPAAQKYNKATSPGITTSSWKSNIEYDLKTTVWYGIVATIVLYWVRNSPFWFYAFSMYFLWKLKPELGVGR